MAKLPVFAPQATAAGDFEWFAYGSSLDFDAFKAWCGEHGYAIPDLAAAAPARLEGWRIAFNVRSNFWGGVVASVLEAPNEFVEGIRIPLPAGALGLVRHKEGVLSGLFQERELDARTRLYVASPERTVPEAKPAPRF